jgi:hypothetical protein
MSGLSFSSLLGPGAPVLGLLVCVAAHILLSRHARGLRRDLAVAVAAGVGFAATATAAWAATDVSDPGSVLDAWSSGIMWALTYLALTYAYIFGFFNLGESARRIRLLIELRAAGAQGLTLERLLAAYNAEMILDARLRRLLAAGQIVARGGRYHIQSRSMLRGARALVLLKRLYLGAPTEFEAAARSGRRSSAAATAESYRIARNTR